MPLSRTRTAALWLMTAAISLALISPVRAAAPSNDDIAAPLDVTLGQTYDVDNTEATDGVDDPPCESSTIHRTVWFSFTAPSNMTIIARARPWVDNDVEIAAIELDDDAPLACEDRFWEGQTESLRLQVTEGSEYYFMVGDARAQLAGGPITFDVHGPLEVSQRIDEVAWAHATTGLSVATGRVRCSRTEAITIHAVLSRSGTEVAEGGRELTCPASRTRLWSVRMSPYDDGPDFRPATLRITYIHDDDGVQVIQTRDVTFVRCTWIGTLTNDRFEGTGKADRMCGLHGDDRLLGGGNDDVAFGGPGADRLVGATGDDRLFGGAGRDELLGLDGRDLLMGEGGNDRLDGGLLRDRCRGGEGRDQLVGCEA